MGKQQSLTVWDRELYQYPVIDHNGKEYEKGYIYICIYIYVCMYKWITLLSNRNWYNIIDQLYVNKIIKRTSLVSLWKHYGCD